MRREKDALEMQVRKLELEVQEKAKDNARLSEQWDQQRAQQHRGHVLHDGDTHAAGTARHLH